MMACVTSIAFAGLVPIWATDRKEAAKLINACCETAAKAAKFKDASAKRRCLIPADGFYEWQKLDPRTKQPFAIVPLDSPMFAFAGLWERWRDPTNQEVVRTFTIITTAPNELMAPIHDRMPVVLKEKDRPQWLG